MNEIEQLFKTHYAQMFRVALILVHNEDTARDIVHNIFAALLDIIEQPARYTKDQLERICSDPEFRELYNTLFKTASILRS